MRKSLMVLAGRSLLLLIVAPSFFLTDTLLGAANSFTIDQVMSAPFASSPRASPKGAKVAWLLDEQGRRNVWFASAPDWKGRKLTAFNDDDGQEIAELSWAPDGSYLLFARGGDFEMGRDNPNPAVSPQKPEQAIWRVDLDGKPARKLVEGHAPAVSPHADVVAFVRAGQIYTMKPTGEAVTNIITAKGRAGDLQWSPDGLSLAFVNGRGDHSFIGVYNLERKTITYLNPSVDSDSDPVWSPDGNRIAYIRVPATTRAFAFGPEREGEPWSIQITDLNGGASRRTFEAAKGPGSVFHSIVGDRQIIWTADNQLVFPWERSGWCHLYSVPVDGGAPVELTRGEGEVEHVAAASDRQTIYYSTNIGDIDRRHVYKLAGAGSMPKAVTQGEGIEWAPAPIADNATLVFLASAYNQRAHAVVQTGSAESKPLAPEATPSDFPKKELVRPEQVLITAADGLTIHGQLFLPPASQANQRHPGLIFFHGGSRRQMLLGFHYMFYYSNAYSMNQYLANHGYVVLSLNYRSGIGYGLDFREALQYGATGASEFNDVIGAGLYMKSRADVDPSKIGVWGGSYGGYLTALALSRSSDLFAAGVDFHGVHDWNEVIENFVPAYNPKTQADAARIAFQSSPMASINGWKSPVLLIHGDDDRNVPFSQTVELAEALRKQNVYFEQLIFPNEIHDFLLQKSWVDAYKAAADFFDRKLVERN